jgi:PhnB protein
MAMTLDPYIFFNGNCKEAMEFYKGVFGGEITLQTYEQAGQGNMGLSGESIMHAELSGGEAKLFASDTKEASGEAKKIHLCLGGDDEAKMTKIFEGLSDGGKVFQPLQKMFWGDMFGSVTDKYGVEWMMNISLKK